MSYRALVCSAALVATAVFARPAVAQSVNDPNLQVQTWVRGLDRPVGADFFNSRGDLFAIEKNTGRVQIIRNRKVRSTALDLNVANDSERGLLGMTLSPTFNQDNFVYLYYTASATGDGGAAIGNQIVRYQYDGEKLVFKKKLMSLPSAVGPNHDGGKLTFGPDGKLYTVIGDLNLNNANSNYAGQPVAGSGQVLRMEPWGAAPADNPFYKASRVGQTDEPANHTYAYGVRNSFGIAFDPVSGTLFESENGRTEYDELNRVTPGFNSGWEKIMGPVARNGGSLPRLVSFGPEAHYEDPLFAWKANVAPTDLLFFETQKLGAQYKNDLFVGTTRGGKILRFDLTPDRLSLILTGDLADGVADSTDEDRFKESGPLIFGQDFGTVADLLMGPGGMFVVSYGNNAIYRITPQQLQGLRASGLLLPDSVDPSLFASASATQGSAAVPEPTGTTIALLAAGATLLRRHRYRHRHRQ